MSGGLFRDIPATENQQRLALAPPASSPPWQPPKQKPRRVSQADLLLEMLRQRRAKGKALELPEILRTGIAQFTARIFELRKRGNIIDNELKHAGGGVRSRYFLRFDVQREGQR